MAAYYDSLIVLLSSVTIKFGRFKVGITILDGRGRSDQ